MQAEFIEAKPIWIEGKAYEMNITVGFRTVVPKQQAGKVVHKIAASSLYRFFVNGEFAGHGPARGPHGYYRIDEWDITEKLTEDNNILAIEVVGYNINSYYILNQPSFLQAEVICDNRVIVATSASLDSEFSAALLNERIQKVQRYSFQRTFVEAYSMKEGFDQWRENLNIIMAENCVETEVKKLLPRRIYYPDFLKILPVKIVARGAITCGKKPDEYWRDRALVNIGEKLKGFKIEELKVILSDEIMEIESTFLDSVHAYIKNDVKTILKERSFQIFDFGSNITGFIGIRVKCDNDCKLILTFDEVLRNGDVDFKRLECANAVSFELEKGEYLLETIEPYTLKYLKIMNLKGDCKIENLYIKEYASSGENIPRPDFCTDKLEAIYSAAIMTYRQNAVDVFMDCPSRERAGWACDSFFTGRVEHCLTGKSLIERNFLENYLLPDKFEHLPDGMLPMCYPADHNDGVFIPNWALWLVLELEEYLKRSGDRTTIDEFKMKVYKLFDYFKPYKNEFGLLEKLDSWIFVEWSKANEFIQDINYPTNMLYAAALAAASRLYNDDNLKFEADNIKAAIRNQSYNGKFFIDNAIRQDGKVVPTENTTEVCQYYAFFFDIAQPETYPELWNILTNDFGPQRAINEVYPKVYPANAFIGNYLRLDLLSRYGITDKVISEIEGYFYYMSEKTGTLWEHNGDYASCNHGFASYVAYWLLKHIKSIS